jgi:hypothetical protein
MPQLAMNKTFALFPVGERPWSIVIKDGVLSENVPSGAVDDDEFTRVSI